MKALKKKTAVIVVIIMKNVSFMSKVHHSSSDHSHSPGRLCHIVSGRTICIFVQITKGVSYKQLLACTNSVRLIFYEVFAVTIQDRSLNTDVVIDINLQKDNKRDLIKILALNPMTNKPVVHKKT